jgi:hypothetical protein
MTTSTSATRPSEGHAAGGRSDLRYDAVDTMVHFEDGSVPALRRQLDGLGKAITAHPALAIGLGLAIGYVLARILHRG